MGELKKGLFITFEGIDGIGKTVVAQAFAKFLKDIGEQVIFTKTPGGLVDGKLVGSPIGEHVRAVLFGGDINCVTYESKSLLLLADHVDSIHRIIEPNTSAGVTVISDRFIDSQFACWDVPEDDKIKLMFRQLYTRKPDITFLLIGEPVICLNRALHRGVDDSKKQANKTWNTVADLTRIQNAYVEELKDQARTIPIDTRNCDIGQVNAKIQSWYREWLRNKQVIIREQQAQ